MRRLRSEPRKSQLQLRLCEEQSPAINVPDKTWAQVVRLVAEMIRAHARATNLARDLAADPATASSDIDDLVLLALPSGEMKHE